MFSEQEESPLTYQSNSCSGPQNKQCYCQTRHVIFSCWLHVVVPIVSLTALISLLLVSSGSYWVSIHTKDHMRNRVFTFNDKCSREDIISIGNTIGNFEGLILVTSGIKIGLLIGIATVSLILKNAKNNRIVGTMGYLILSTGYLVIEILMLAMYDKTAAQLLSMSTVCLQPNIIFSILRTRSRHLVLAATVLDCFLVFSNLIYFCQAVKIRFKKNNLDEVN